MIRLTRPWHYYFNDIKCYFFYVPNMASARDRACQTNLYIMSQRTERVFRVHTRMLKSYKSGVRRRARFFN